MPVRYQIKDCAKKKIYITEFGVGLIRTAISHARGERLNGEPKAQKLAHT